MAFRKVPQTFIGMRVITVRVSDRVHEAIREEARLRGVSMNRLFVMPVLDLLRDHLSPNVHAHGAIKELEAAERDPGPLPPYKKTN